MKITLNFGLNSSKKQVYWYQDIMSFPKVMEYNKKKWEWIFYTKDDKSDYILTFGELPIYDLRYNEYMPIFEEMFKNSGNECCCGAIYTSFPWDHMRMCKLWKSWDSL